MDTRAFRIGLLFCLAVSAGSRLWGQEARTFAHTAAQMKYVFARYHVKPMPFDDVFSERVFYLFAQSVDPFHNYLTAADWDSLRVYEHTLDNELNGENPGRFLADFGRLYRTRWEKILAMANVYYATRPDYSEKESYELEHERSQPPAGDDAWENHWHKKMKFSVLSRMAESLGNDSAGVLPDTASERRARSFMQKVYMKRGAKVLTPEQGYERMLSEYFFNAVAQAHDPHSLYIPAQEKQAYDRELNAMKMSFGVDIDENEDGEFFVLDVIPGSSAWYSGNIKTDDILLRWISKNREEVEFIDLGADDVWELFNGNPEDTLVLVVKSQNGPERTVTLKKELIRAQEGLVKSWVLKGKKKIGYISLPGFYFDWFSENPTGCANDVAREILKMRREQIDGLILDVRDNGGGSFWEAVEMAGIFIPDGPLLYTWEQGDKPRVTKDPFRGTVYDGPLLLMVNGESASASEVLADILQDYNRALVVGTPSFGKASMQITLPLDSIQLKLLELYGDSYYSPQAGLDYVNVTNGKLYRITGKNHQAHGMTPDIILPDCWAKAYAKETDYPYLLEADSIKGSAFSPLRRLPVTELRNLSQARTAAEYPFTEYARRADEVRELMSREGQVFPLEWNEFMAFYRQNQTRWDEIDSLAELRHNPFFEVRTNAYDALHNLGNSYETEWQNRMKTYIAGDPQLMETYRILLDYLQLGKSRRP